MSYSDWMAKWGIRTRESWLTARWIGGSSGFQPAAITHMTEHYMGENGVDVSDTPRLLNRIQASYAVARGYDVGYSFAVDESGILWELRGLRVMAASDGWPEINVQTVSCLAMRPNIGDDLLPVMVTAQQTLMAAVRDYLGRDVPHWVKHRDVNPGTGCCGIPIGVRVDTGQLEPNSAPAPPTVVDMPTLITVPGVITLVSTSSPPTHIEVYWVDTQDEANRLSADINVAKQSITPQQCKGIRLNGRIPPEYAGLFKEIVGAPPGWPGGPPASPVSGPVQEHTHDIQIGGSGNVRR